MEEDASLSSRHLSALSADPTAMYLSFGAKAREKTPFSSSSREPMVAYESAERTLTALFPELPTAMYSPLWAN